MVFQYDPQPERTIIIENQRVVTAAVGNWIPFSNCPSFDESVNPLDHPLLDHCDGFEPQRLKLFANRLNYTVKFAPWGYNSWGSLEPNGSWNGHIGRIIRGEVDIAIGGITHTHARAEVVALTTQVYEIAKHS